MGSTRVVTNAAGVKIAEYKFAPYGEKEVATGAGSDYQFTDKAEDATTGLSYFGARFYDPEVGRFINQDPTKQDLNWYAYCGNNPLNRVDPDGKAYDLVDVGFFAWSAADFVKDPSLENFGWMVVDGVSLLPVVPSTGYVRRGIQLINKADNVIKGTVKASSRALGRNLEKAGFARGVNEVAHHIVAGNSKKAEYARSVLEKFSVGINDAVNGLFYDASKHAKMHTDEYYQKVNGILEQVTSKNELTTALQDIATQITEGTF